MYYRYYHYPGDHQVQQHYGVRTDRYKLIYFHRIDSWELYDLARDPHELNNVYGDKAYADTVSTLKRELTRLRAEFGDHDQYVDGPPGFAPGLPAPKS
jgi:Arylsulfatase A and related enzymes